MNVLYIYAAFCILAIIVGVLEVRQSFEPQHWEVRAGLLWILLLGSLIFLTTVDWERSIRVSGAIGIAVAFAAGIVLGYMKPRPLIRRQIKPSQHATPKKIDYPHKGDDFCVSGYEDTKGNRVPLGS